MEFLSGHRKSFLIFVIILFAFIITYKTTYNERIYNTRPIPATMPEDIKFQIECLYNPDVNIRINTIDNFSRMGKNAKIAIPWLTDLLGDKTCPSIDSVPVAANVAALINKIGGEEAFQALILATENDNPTMRYFSIWAFADDKDGHLERKAIPYVIKLAKDRDRGVRESAANRLSSLAGMNFGDDINAWERWWKSYQWQHPTTKDASVLP